MRIYELFWDSRTRDFSRSFRINATTLSPKIIELIKEDGMYYASNMKYIDMDSTSDHEFYTEVRNRIITKMRNEVIDDILI